MVSVNCGNKFLVHQKRDRERRWTCGDGWGVLPELRELVPDRAALRLALDQPRELGFGLRVQGIGVRFEGFGFGG